MTPRFNTVRDELTFNADDNEHTSESPKKHFRTKVRTLKHYEFINILSLSDERSYEKLLVPRLEDSPRTRM